MKNYKIKLNFMMIFNY